MADFNLDRIRFRWRGEWVAGTSYVKDDMVYYQGKTYACLIGHDANSTYFYTDLNAVDSKWELMLDGWVWRNNWTISTYYTEGEIVKFNGYVYQCITNHTSTNLINTGLPADIANWKIVATTYNWLNNWTVGTYYNLGDVVRYRGITYICNLKHRANISTAIGLEGDQSSWTVVTTSDSWYADWTVGRRYKVKDIVKYGAIVYRCIDDHTSAATAELGLEANLADWEIVISGIEYKFDWEILTRYKLNDIVKWNHSLWICTDDHTSGATNLRNDESNWTIWLPGTGYEAVWDSTIEYKKGDIVLHGGYAFTALNNNINSLPSVNGIIQNTGNWELLKQGYKHRGEWSSITAYKTGDVVRNNGYLYVAIDDSAGAQPDTGTDWTVLVTGSYWKNNWEEPVTYNIGDIVTRTGTSYYCTARHNSNAVDSRPDIDAVGDALYWIILIQNNTSNVLTTQGDIRTHDDTTTIARAIGDSGNTLKVLNNNAVWQNFEEINKVYYVATSGINIVGAGTSLNSPFRTVKYAMEFIQADLANRAPATVFVKTGIYEEILPISIPAGVALVGDELRSTNIQPAAGYEASNMFYMRNGSGLRNMTLQGLSGTLGSINAAGTRRPTAGAFVGLDPGTGTADSTVWITTKSPYVQNVTTFGTACVGMKIDGTLHASGNKSIVANDFTQVISDGIGYWANDTGRSELVSVFTYYCYIGYLASNGGILRATNGNNSYGTYGSRAEGFSALETPIAAEIDNRTKSAQAYIVHTDASSIVAVGYSNTGENYTDADISISGTGIGATAVYEEYRDNAITELRIISPSDSSTAGGLNYQYLLNNAQAGDEYSITLAASDTTGTAGKYVGMRIFIDAGTGIGQYGEITAYDDVSKIATISRDSDGQTGWDHIYDGYPIEPVLDSSTRYRVEPRLIVQEPSFQSSSITGPAAQTWQQIAYGEGHFVACSAGGAGAAYSSYSINNGTTWSSPLSLGTGYSITGLVYTGSKFLAARGSQGAAELLGAVHNTILQSANGETWSTVTLPGSQKWSCIAADSIGSAVVIGSDSQIVAYSSDNGDSWSAASIPGTTELWNVAAYGKGKFITISLYGDVAYSTNSGVTWTIAASALPTLLLGRWTDLKYGNDRFVALSSTGEIVYSFDAITWYSGQLPYIFTNISYGAGLFIATGYNDKVSISTNGKVWRLSRDDSTAYALSNTGSWKASAYNSGRWIVVQSGSTEWNTIQTGARAIGRVEVTSSRITKTIIYNPGSNYLGIPYVTIIDPENTAEVIIQARKGNGVLPQPRFTNRGIGYVTATAQTSGDGYADIYQIGKTLYLKNVTGIPGPGDNLIISDIDDVVYRIVAVDTVTGSAPSYNIELRISPTISNQESPEHSTAVIIRQFYSQIRLTGHDFLDIGTGNINSTQYPELYVEGFQAENVPAPENEASEYGGGRVFYTSTDQDGNFRVGELFTVEQNTGIVSINADFFELSGLEELSLGGIQVGGTAVIIREFSKEPTFSANSNNIVPTQRAIIRYIESRISSGGADAATTTLIAGRIRVSGHNITTTSGEAINVPVQVNHTGFPEGDYLTHQYFMFGSKSG